MKERIRLIQEQLGLSQIEFANKLGISPASLSSILTGRTNPTSKHIMGIHQGFPEINVNWLMFGEGTMLAAGHEGNDELQQAEKTNEDASASENSVTAEEQLGGENIEQRSLFTQEQIAHPTIEQKVAAYGSRREQRSTIRGNGSVISTAINIDKDERRIKEIRVFYNNGTYESFVPSNR